MNRLDKLSKKDREELTFDLVNALVACKNMGEAALFLQDILTMNEMKMLSKRLRIAKLLIAGKTYEEIEKILHVSHSTVAKIAAWLSERGEGFRKVVASLPAKQDEKQFEDFSEWDKMKRRYSMYFWPELLLEEIVKNANKKQKERIRSVINRLEEKNELHKKLNKLLYS